ncbi:MAG: glycosyltransferase [Hyphomicrobiales bacterium]|nr:glycosyltransferase [Hyphomicrobiales bacterium]
MLDRSDVGAVVIGRNEGVRLVRCLASVANAVKRMVYVDSGSSDGSLEAARTAGAKVVELDPGLPFTAARARNAGFAALMEGEAPAYVQFIDGDCILQPGWIATAMAFLDANPKAAVACGRRRELSPEASVYNRLCDWEWDTPVGSTKACGGDMLVRLSAFAETRGFNATLIAGEEPELCLRLRQKGWEVWRLDTEMTLHDAAMTRFGQWWKRCRRSGHAYAEGMALHGTAPERHGVAGTLRAVVWGLAIPLATLAFALWSHWAWLLLLAYPAQVIRLAFRGDPGQRLAWERAIFLTMGKFPEAVGVFAYWLGRLVLRPARLIEYK